MWTYLKWGFRILFWLLVAAFLHYTLPQHDVARIADAYPKRVDFGENWWFYSHAGAGDAEGVTSRDVFFIAAVKRNGDAMEYRNEDTGWSWPPYFKFDTATLQTEAADMKSTAEAPKWVAIKHYGWRSNLYSIYPNAISIKPVDDPDAYIVPWTSIVILVILAAFYWAIRVRWNRFRAARIDPVLENVEEGFDAAGDKVSDTGSRVKRWFNSWRG